MLVVILSLFLSVLQGSGALIDNIQGMSSIACLLPNPIFVQAALAATSALSIVQGLTPTPQTAEVLAGVQTTLINVLGAMVSLINDAPLALSPYTAANVSIFKGLFAVQTALALAPNNTLQQSQLQLQYAAMLKSYYYLLAENFSGSNRNQSGGE